MRTIQVDLYLTDIEQLDTPRQALVPIGKAEGYSIRWRVPAETMFLYEPEINGLWDFREVLKHIHDL